MTHRLMVCLVLSVAFTALGHAACRSDIPASTPTSAFTLHDDGTATHNLTGLMWMRCPLGENWDGASCVTVDARGIFTWSEALQAATSSNWAGYSDWRLPNIKELQSIVEVACSFPAINVEVFPISGSWFWSSSPSANYPGDAWAVSFDFGEVSNGVKSGNSTSVRLVRGGQ